ncbi:MAG: fructose-6-phosphate aldolase [Rhizobiales bacterium]|nr:fructose-6-phosphate aldolase [Hyphomicrobiales bacterium]
MEIFIDTGSVRDITGLTETNLLNGVTTNPTLIAMSGRDFINEISDICSLVDGPVSAEVTANDTEGMITEGMRLSEIAPNVVVKLPITMAGLKACNHFSKHKIKTNLTLCFTEVQALMAAKAGATYVSPFIGRLDDVGIAGSNLITGIRKIFDNYNMETKILAASIRTVNHVKEVAIAGADIATMPRTVFDSLLRHPLTTVGLMQFEIDWKNTGQSIL